MMWVLFALVCIEAGVTHFLIALWNVAVAIVLSIFSLSLAVWMIVLIRSFRLRPVLLEPRHVRWRCGFLRDVAVPLDQISRCEQWTLDGLRREGLFNAGLIAHPNIVLRLRFPVRVGRRQVHYLAHRLDDPKAFNAALDALTSGNDRLH